MSIAKSLIKSSTLIGVGIAVGYFVFDRPQPPTPSESPPVVVTEAPQDISITVVADATDDIKREGQTIIVSKAYRDRLVRSDMVKVLQDAKITPVVEGATVKGYRLSRIKRDSVFERAGFKDGDIIGSVNGQALNGSGDAIHMMQSLGDAPSAKADSKADGKALR